MIRILLISLLLAAGPMAAQRPPVDAPPLRGGSRVRVFMEADSARGADGLVLSGTRDTLLLVSPALGLARLPAGDIHRLETTGGRGPVWKYPAYVVALSAAAGLVSPPEDFFPMFMNGLIVFGIAGGIAYRLEPPRRAHSIDPAQGLPEVRQDPARPGVPVRVSTAARPLTPELLHDFSADSVYLFSGGASTPVARVEIRELQVSMGRDRRTGAVWGGRIGAAAGAVAAASWVAGAEGEGRYLVAPFLVVIGGGTGWLVGAPAGWALAPRKWADVPVHARPR